MNRFWRWLGGSLLLLSVVGFLLPSSARVERDIDIDAYPATVHALLNNPRRFPEWSPLTETDPNARLEFSGPPRGVGATVSWQGRVLGQGRQTIVESEAPRRVVLRIDAYDGRDTRSTFVLDEIDAGTRLTWTWQRSCGLNLAARYFALFQDGIRGPGQERGLRRLADIAAGLPRTDFSDLEIRETFTRARDIAYITTQSAPEAASVAVAMSNAFNDIHAFIDRHGLQEAGPPLSITRAFSGAELVFDAAIPVDSIANPVPAAGSDVRLRRTYEGPALRVRHRGTHAELAQTHEKIAAYLAASGVTRNGDAWESYVNEAGGAGESGLLTDIYYPVRD